MYRRPVTHRLVCLGDDDDMGKHLHAFRKLGRDSAHRWAMLRTMADQLIRHERIETTVPKAKELRRVADKMISLGKEGTLAARRRAKAILRTDESIIKLFGPLAERYKEREGGYTRVMQTRTRVGDAAKMAYIEYVDRVGELRPRKTTTDRHSRGVEDGMKEGASLTSPAAEGAAEEEEKGSSSKDADAQKGS